MSERVLFDTNILISFYNQGLYEDCLIPLIRQSDFFVSAVTLNEFVRGAHDKTSQEIALSLMELIRDKILTPSEAHWLECARLSERFLKKRNPSKLEVLLLQNDILIALGARDAQARLITADKKDFKIISQFLEVEIEYW